MRKELKVRVGSQSRLQRVGFETTGQYNKFNGLRGRERWIPVPFPPPLAQAQLFSGPPLGGKFPLCSRVIRFGLNTALAPRYLKSFSAGPYSLKLMTAPTGGCRRRSGRGASWSKMWIGCQGKSSCEEIFRETSQGLTHYSQDVRKGICSGEARGEDRPRTGLRDGCRGGPQSPNRNPDRSPIGSKDEWQAVDGGARVATVFSDMR